MFQSYQVPLSLLHLQRLLSSQVVAGGIGLTGLILRAQDSYFLHDARKVANDHSLSFH